MTDPGARDRRPAFVRVLDATRGRGRCQACAAPIVWFETEGGKRMPFNAGLRVASTELVERAGARVVIAVIAAEFSHWATCPAADRFRRRGRA